MYISQKKRQKSSFYYRKKFYLCIDWGHYGWMYILTGGCYD